MSAITVVVLFALAFQVAPMPATSYGVINPIGYTDFVFGNHNVLAHDNQFISALKIGDVVDVNGSCYEVRRIIIAESLQPTSSRSSYRYNGKTYTIEQWVKVVYGNPRAVGFQTCIGTAMRKYALSYPCSKRITKHETRY